jgi:hypothetical protein
MEHGYLVGRFLEREIVHITDDAATTNFGLAPDRDPRLFRV